MSRRFWARSLYKNRNLHGFCALNFNHMYYEDPEQFLFAVRMRKDVFDVLFRLLEHDLSRHSNRPFVPAKWRLFLTLVYLAHGGNKQMFSMAFKMGLTSVRRIVNQTCDVIWTNLSRIQLSVPTGDEWKDIAEEFRTTWNLPNCVGAIDAKHISIKCPNNAGSLPYNYNGHHAIVLLAICDANFTFRAIDIGVYGPQSDGGVLWTTTFGKSLLQGRNEFGLPEDAVLPKSYLAYPYYFVGDAAFPLKSFLMRPYPGLQLTPDRAHFNERLSRARRTIDNAFGILAARWKILMSPLYMSPQSAEKVVKAAVVLHNFVKSHEESYLPTDYADHYDGDNLIHGLWRESVTPLQRVKRTFPTSASKNAFKLRDQLKDYLFHK